MNEVPYKNEYMSRLVRHIEENLPSVLDAGLLSRAGYVSHAKLYRGFYNLTGHSVKEYVRKRRLSNALALIKSSDFAFADIAFQCGYSSHQALCRAIKQTLNMTPTEYKDGDTYYYFPPFTGEPLQSVTVSNETIPRALCVLYYHSSIMNIENKAINAFLNAVPDYNGQIFGRNGKQEGTKYCYKLYLTDIKRNYTTLCSCGFKVTYEIPCINATFATSSVQNDDQKINAAWDYLYSEWLQISMFEYTDEPYYEEYILKNNKIFKLKLHLPIRKRSEDTKITLIKNPELHFIVAKAKGYNAERIASQTAVDYLAAHYPYIINKSKDLYLRKDMNSYICGICIDTELQPLKDENVFSITMEQNNYLMLESSVIGDYDWYADMLLSFARDNGMTADKKDIFAVYDAKVSFDILSLKMYCSVKIDTK